MARRINRKQSRAKVAKKKKKATVVPIQHQSTRLGSNDLLTEALNQHQKNNLTAAEKLYRTLLDQTPDNTDAQHLLGLIYSQRGRHARAIEFYNQAIILDPGLANAYNNRGLSLREIGEYAQAIDSFKKSIEIDPNNPDSHYYLGRTLNKYGDAKEAAEHLKKTIQLNPQHVEAYYSLGDTLNRLHQHDEAIGYLKHALLLNPQHTNAFCSLTLTLRRICDWSQFDEIKNRYVQWNLSASRPLLPFSFLMWSDDPEAQQQCARAYTEASIKKELQPINAIPPANSSRIKIAYISSDFREHPVAHLTAELYELHDRNKFEITAIAYGASDSSPMRKRLIKAFDHFHEVGHMSDADIAELIASRGTHIVVDLIGHTSGARPNVLAYRPAPVQINYLGYIGTMGAEFIDYILVDEFSVPKDQQPFFDEELVHLPCYMVTDSKREITTEIPTRASCGLPNEGFVYCCFNNTYKITPEIFDIWMRCLDQVPGSVLWILGDNEWAEKNLRDEANRRNIDPDRLIFAPRTDSAKHLARQQLADLFLDTLPINAGATASDALWTGLPVLTCTGKSFVARMGGGLAHAAGLPELVVDSLDAYENLALSLAKQPALLNSYRNKLIDNHDTSPLFDNQKFCNNLEQVFTSIFEKWRSEQVNTLPSNNKKTSANTENQNQYIDELFEKAISLHRQQRVEEAKVIYQEILYLDNKHADALHYLGVLYASHGKHKDALELYEKSISYSPNNPTTYNNLGVSLNSLNKLPEALNAFQKAIEIDPSNAESYRNLGSINGYLGRQNDAKECFLKALEIMPGHSEAHYNLGVVFSNLLQFNEAENHYIKALESSPDHIGALNNLGIIYKRKKELNDACRCFKRVLEIKPGHSKAVSHLAICLRQLCDWNEFDKTKITFEQWNNSTSTPLLPFSYLMWTDDPQAQQQCARAYSNTSIMHNLQSINSTPASDDTKIKIAYVSADFGEHPVSYLTAELYELHDRSKFEITAIAYGPHDNSAMRKRLIKAFDHFHEAGHMNDVDIARLIASKGIHIVVDLMGHTSGARPNVLAARPAPIQINYLGYMGTMGADFIDYILVDKFCVPSNQQPFFDEKLVHLPCYMVTDSQREIAQEIPTRTENGLPDDAFVFCSFNNTYKITPKIFDIWMRCLDCVPKSVLWLLSDNESTQENLRKEAKRRGIDPDRLIFAPQTDSANHLSRLSLADLFLDTLPVNAGATASDTLWAGLPVLTCAGRSFSARMGGGLVHAAGLPELVTENLQDYEKLAIELGNNRERLQLLRSRLTANSERAPLFNSKLFRHNLESAYTKMISVWRDGDTPHPISID